jgi:hypothetical protein
MADPVGNALQNILCPRRHILFCPFLPFQAPKNFNFGYVLRCRPSEVSEKARGENKTQCDHLLLGLAAEIRATQAAAVGVDDK